MMPGSAITAPRDRDRSCCLFGRSGVTGGSAASPSDSLTTAPQWPGAAYREQHYQRRPCPDTEHPQAHLRRGEVDERLGPPSRSSPRTSAVRVQQALAFVHEWGQARGQGRSPRNDVLARVQRSHAAFTNGSALGRPEPSASSGASAPWTCRMRTCEPSRSTTCRTSGESGSGGAVVSLWPAWPAGRWPPPPASCCAAPSRAQPGCLDRTWCYSF